MTPLGTAGIHRRRRRGRHCKQLNKLYTPIGTIDHCITVTIIQQNEVSLSADRPSPSISMFSSHFVAWWRCSITSILPRWTARVWMVILILQSQAVKLCHHAHGGHETEDAGQDPKAKGPGKGEGVRLWQPVSVGFGLYSKHDGGNHQEECWNKCKTHVVSFEKW